MKINGFEEDAKGCFGCLTTALIFLLADAAVLYATVWLVQGVGRMLGWES